MRLWGCWLIVLAGYCAKRSVWSIDSGIGQTIDLLYCMLTGPLLVDMLRRRVDKMRMRYGLLKLMHHADRRPVRF